MSKNFFYISQYFTPEPYLKDIDFIKSLKEKGWNPIVITGYPNYPKGEIYDTYKNKLMSEEWMDGIKVIRTFTFADHSLKTYKRILNYFFFGIFATWAIIKHGKTKSFYYILQSSPFVLMCAFAIRVFKPRSKILLDIQDVFPENIRVSGFVKQKWKIDFLDFILNKFYYKIFDLFVVVSESFKKIIINKGFSKDKILTLYNWSMVERKTEERESNYEFSTQGFNIVYAGNIGVHQGLSKLSDGITKITKMNSSVYFHFFGDGTDFDVLKANHINNRNVIFYGRISTEEIGKYMNAADALFIHLIKDPIYKSIIPSKLQAYIEIGKPILAGVDGEARDIVINNKLGVAFGSEDINEMIEATMKMASFSSTEREEIRKRSVFLYKEKFSRDAGVNRLHHFIQNSYDY
jgi:glycosyltransferase involved in cell wall biosynthesis